MTSPHSNDDLQSNGLQSADVTIYFLISLALSFLFYWNSWQVDPYDWCWQILAYCAPFPAAVWLGACAVALPPRRTLLLGLLAGSGGFLLHLFIFAPKSDDLAPLALVPSLMAFVLGGLFLCPSGFAAGRKFLAGLPVSEPQNASASNHPHARDGSRPSTIVYVQTVLGFLSPIIVALIDLRNR